MSTKPTSPLLGYNNNVRHKGKVFHIQTEDSGVRYGHVITHLFMDGGRILKSTKTSYAEYMGNDRLGEIVREMMKHQHKAMFIALRDGKFESVIDGSGDPSGRMPTLLPPSAAMRQPPGEPATSPVEGRASDAAMIAPTRRPGTPGPSPSSFGKRTDEPVPTLDRRSPEDVALDLDALDRAAAAASVAPPAMRAVSDLPPPPANLLRERTTTGKYRINGLATPPAPRAGDTPAPLLATSGPLSGSMLRPPSQTAVASPAEPRRYAPTRPASIFGQARPQQGKSIFGEDLLRDKSLDEVILSYLADDADGMKEKK